MNPVGSYDHLRRARASYDAHRYDISVTSSLDAIAIEPHDPIAHVILSLSYDRLGRLDEAEAAARRAIELDPEEPRAFIALGVVRLSQGRYPEALKALREAARLDPDDDDAFRLSAIAQMNQQHFLDALGLIGQALAIAPDVVASREVRAMILRLMGRREEAEAETAAVLRLHPESVLGLSQAGFLTLQRGDPERARAAFREALRLDPTSKSVRAGYERVILSTSGYATFCGRQLNVAGVFFFLSCSSAQRVSSELAAASLVTSISLFGINRPLANEALRRDEIGRTFVAPRTQRRDRGIMLAVAGAETAGLLGALLLQPALFYAAFGCFVAAAATGRTADAALGTGTRRRYGLFAVAIALACALASVLTVAAGGFEALGSGHGANARAAEIALLATALAVSAFVACDAVVCSRSYAAAFANARAIVRRRSARR